MKWYRNNETGEFRKFENDPGAGWEAASAAEKADLERQINELVAKIEEYKAERRAVTPPTGEDRSSEFSLAKCIRGFVHDDWSKADHERKLVKEWQERATTLTTSNDTYGGFIVPPEYLGGEFVRDLYNSVAAMAAGARELQVSGGPVIIPTQETGSTAYWVGEGSAITASDATFGQKTAQPHALAGLVRISNRLLRDSNPSVEAIVRDDIARILGVELDRAIFLGSGASGQPTGIFNVTGVNDAAIGGAITPDGIWDMIFKIEDAKVPFNNGAIVLSPKQWNELLQAADGAGTPKFSADIYPNIGKSFAGGTIPIHTTHNLSAGYGLVGVYSECLVVRWGGLQFAASQDASDGTNHAFTLNETFIRAIMDVDVIVKQPKAFCLEDGFT